MIEKLRVSMHSLKVEMGRRCGIAPNLRICHCGQGVEDELHFLTQCPSYMEIRHIHHITDQKLSEILNKKQYIEYIDQLQKHRSTLQ